MFSKKMFSVLFGVGILVSFNHAASAATISCSGTNYDISANVSNARACAILAPIDGAEAENPANVQNAGFFGINDWSREGRYQGLNASGGNDTSDLFDFSGNRESGSFTYVGSGAAPESVMFVFFHGNENNNTNLVAYLLDLSDGSGTYATPFTEPPFDFPNNNPSRNINRIAVYVSASQAQVPGEGEVPEPGSLALLGLGMLGLLSRRRKA